MATSLSHLVLETLPLHAHNRAVVYDDGVKTCCLTYTELLDIARKLKTVLQQYVSKGDIIAVCLAEDMTMAMLPAILLGVLLAKSAFYNMTENSLQFSCNIVKELKTRAVIVHALYLKDIKHTFRMCDIHFSKTTTLPPPLDSLVLVELDFGQRSLCDMDLAYCITTSGTTGRPKIVRVPHRCIVPNIIHLRSLFEINSNDIVLNASPLTFDPSIVEIFMTLGAGACLLLVPSRVRMVPSTLLHIIGTRNKVTVIQATPTLLRRFDYSQLSKTLLGSHGYVRVMALGGEMFPACSEIRKMRGPNNETQFYNLYGTTEVSCWATCHQVTAEQLCGDDPIPLGQALDGTTLQVRDKSGETVTKGTGILFIGGTARQCILEDDDIAGYRLGSLKMRSTGDLVQIDADGHLLYLGREDHQLKIHGQRLNLEEISQVARKHEMVVDCAATIEGSHIVLYAVLKRGEETLPSLSGLHDHLEGRLPPYSLPQDIVPVTEIPMTRHGKLDARSLSKLARQRIIPASQGGIEEQLKTAWQETLGLADVSISEEDNFLQKGGNSIKAIELLNIMELGTSEQFPDFFGILFLKTFSDVKQYIINVIHSDHRRAKKIKISKNKDTRETKNVLKDLHTTYNHVGTIENLKTQSSYLLENLRNYVFYLSISRGNRLFFMMSENQQLVPAVDKADIVDLVLNKHGLIATPRRHQISEGDGMFSVCVDELWQFNTGKCVDATPILTLTRNGEGVVYIGSHSHSFSALCARTGELLWEINLPDRVESSACLSLCGYFVTVGCYDGKIYILSAHSGDLWWKVETGSEVKCSPQVDHVNGYVYIGSHSQQFYALNIQDRHVVWCQDLQSGSIFASPVVGYSPHRVYAATLGGALVAMDASTGEEKWRYMCPKPVFSSPTILPGGVCVGCTDGVLYMLDHHGNQVWSFKTSGPLFSSPCFLPTKQMLEGSNQVINSFMGGHADRTCSGINPHTKSVRTNKALCLKKTTDVCEQCEESLSQPRIDCVDDLPSDDRNLQADVEFPEMSDLGSKCVSDLPEERDVLCVGSHDKCVYCISSDGRQIWRTSLNSPVYATPFLAVLSSHTAPYRHHIESKNGERAEVRNENGFVFIDVMGKESDMDNCRGDVAPNVCSDNQGKTRTTERIDARTPNRKDGKSTDAGSVSGSTLSAMSLPVVVAASTQGTLYVLDRSSGTVMCERQLGGEVFSSPVVHRNNIYIGCRDDSVYCFTVSVTHTLQQ